MFRRRVALHPLERLRETVWPRAGWKRTFQYGWKRVWRLSGTPHAVAIGVAAGAFASCTPFVGFHFVIAFLIAWIVRGNLIASALGTFFGNPLTFPFIWLFTYDLGAWILGNMSHTSEGEALPADVSAAFFMDIGADKILPVLAPMAAGSLPIGLAVSAACYVASRSAVEGYQTRRRERLAKRASNAQEERV